MGNRLRERRGKILVDKLTGVGNLTNNSINTIQNYFGMVIREIANNKNLNDDEKVYQMKKGISAVLNHCNNFPDKLRRHILCPRGLNSRCRWKNCVEGVDIYKP